MLQNAAFDIVTIGTTTTLITLAMFFHNSTYHLQQRNLLSHIVPTHFCLPIKKELSRVLNFLQHTLEYLDPF
jgi:hypothetical protein